MRRPLFAAAALFAAAVAAYPQEAEGRRFALLIGVKDYQGTQLASLKYTENDVTALADLFRPDARRLVLLTQSAAFEKKDRGLFPTASNIRDQLKSLLDNRRPADTVVVAFTGHGVTLRRDGRFYFCPQDADLDKPETLVSLDEVYEELRKCAAGAKVLLVDACRNDPLAGKTGRVAELESVSRPVLARPPGGVAALFSCSQGQQSFESDRFKHGVFFHHVLEGLRGKAAGRTGEVDLERLAVYVKDEVPDAAADEFGARARQVPHLLSDVSGRLTLRRATPAAPAKTLTVDLGDGVAMEFVRVEPGTFTMGSPVSEVEHKASEHQHAVEITRPFYLGKFEVTQEQYARLMGSNPSHFAPTGAKKDKVAGLDTRRFPVESVTWDEANQFCARLTALDAGRGVRRTYRLPTEAEWEFACREQGRSTAPTYFGASLSTTQANFDGNYPYQTGKGTYLERPVSVGSYPPNALGLHDMHGNVGEWCQDWEDEAYYLKSPRQDPPGPAQSPRNQRIIRGGTWFSYGWACRSACRSWLAVDGRQDYYGFRVVLNAP